MGASPKPYRKSYWRRVLNAVVRPLARLGLTGPRTHLLTVPGRKSGTPWSTPVSIVAEDGERWLVAPYGERNWLERPRPAGAPVTPVSRSRDARSHVDVRPWGDSWNRRETPVRDALCH